ncbi:uncharacterized protein PAF06_009623 [Gastrophryne carolinensis]
MECTIKRQFVEDRATVLDALPVSWNVTDPGPYYCVSMKMSRIKNLVFDFEFGSLDTRDMFPVTAFPERILILDLSVNDLFELPATSLKSLKNLMELNVSFNAVRSVPGLLALPNLLVLDLSYNAIFNIEEFKSCTQLVTLNVSHNKIRCIKKLPTLAHLTRLHLNSNKLCSLDGIQNLPKLFELYIHNNKIISLLPLSTSLTLNVLDASSNSLSSFSETLQVVSGLPRLTQLSLKGNPLARDDRYFTAFRYHTSVRILDNRVLGDPIDIEFSPVYYTLLRKSLDSVYRKVNAKEILKDSIKKNLKEKLRCKQDTVESILHHLQSRIRDLQEELKEFEDNLQLEMENCCRYVDAIPPEDLHGIDPHKVQRASEQNLFTKFWERWEHGKRKPANSVFNDLTDSEEVIKAAALLLSQLPNETSEEDS